MEGNTAGEVKLLLGSGPEGKPISTMMTFLSKAGVLTEAPATSRQGKPLCSSVTSFAGPWVKQGGLTDERSQPPPPPPEPGTFCLLGGQPPHPRRHMTVGSSLVGGALSFLLPKPEAHETPLPVAKSDLQHFGGAPLTSEAWGQEDSLRAPAEPQHPQSLG